MKIAIIGCSHSSGVYAPTRYYRELGYLIELASRYPQHEFVNLSTGGTGFSYQKINLTHALEIEADCVILQLTDARVSLPNTRSKYKYKLISDIPSSEIIMNKNFNIGDNYKLRCFERDHQAIVTIESDRILSWQAFTNSFSKNWTFGYDVSDIFRNVHDNSNFIKLLSEDNTVEIDNLKYWMLNVEKIYRNRFKHFFILNYPLEYYKHSPFADMAYSDWKMSVFEWYVDSLMKKHKLNTRKQAIALCNKLVKPIGNHLPRQAQLDMVDEYLLKNERFKFMLESD